VGTSLRRTLFGSATPDRAPAGACSARRFPSFKRAHMFNELVMPAGMSVVLLNAFDDHCILHLNQTDLDHFAELRQQFIHFFR
jgi:hypothetical protein